jgi:hypothetical protein
VREPAVTSPELGLLVDSLSVDAPPPVPVREPAAPPAGHQLAWALAAAAVVFTAVATSWARIFYSDTWISLTAGRQIAAHGLPRVDSLSAAGHGRPWIDQQWLAHLAFYELWRAGGNAAVGAASALAFAAAFGLLAALLVRRGAAPIAVAVALGAALVQCLLFAETRAQSFAYPLFVLLLWILLGESERRVGPRTALVLPVLVVWANVHGSALLGVAVCVAFLGRRSAASARGRAWRLAAGDLALSILAAGTLLVTPYGAAIPGYYARVLGDPALATIAEWQPASFAPLQLPFVLLLIGTLGTVCFARGRGHRIPADVIVIGVLLGALATHAVRYQTWFALGVAPLLALAITRVRPGGAAPRPPKAIVAAAAGLLVAGVAVSAGILAATPERTFDRFVAQPAVESSAAYATAHPDARILADDVTGSQLLWRYPELAGRIAFDARTEVYRPSDFLRFARFLTVSGSSWTAATRGYQAVAVTCSLHPNLCTALDGLDGWRVISRAGGGLVAVRA